MRIYKIAQESRVWISPNMPLDNIKWVPKQELISQLYHAQEEKNEAVIKLIQKECYRRDKAIEKANIKRNEDIFKRLIDEPKQRVK